MSTAQQPSLPPSRPGLLTRISIAFGAFFRIIGDPAYAGTIDRLVFPPIESAPVETARPAAAAVPAFKPVAPSFIEHTPAAALQLLSLLQRDARIIDFSEEDLSGYADADIGAAARVVHEGCRKVFREHFTIVPIRSEAEGSSITLEQGFDAASNRLTGNVAGSAPFSGTLNHRGWRVNDTRLPILAQAHDITILAPAEVDL